MWDANIARANMLTQQIRTWDVLNERILELIAQVPREDFVPEADKKLAFADTQIQLAHDQVMLTPMIEAKVLQALNINAHEKILEVGTGTGYFTALLSRLGHYIYSVDIFPDFTQYAQEKLNRHGYTNVSLQTGNAADGWEKQQPYDVICITGALPRIPENFKQQLKIHGRLFAFVGHAPAMEAIILTRLGESTWKEEQLFETEVPLLLFSEPPNPFVF